VSRGHHPLNRFIKERQAPATSGPVVRGEDSDFSQWSHPDELPDDLLADLRTYQGRINDFVVDVLAEPCEQ